ncbi:hypothetical protein [Sphaerisporangium album]|uniref:hypothetical protein n=1 Tax=Sphaerisporangium album TaxID=509200 RepID=UPI001C6882CC|nr:hypothetical protein [Sphaerisporangium album]
MDGFVADEHDDVGPLHEWYFNGDTPITEGSDQQYDHSGAGSHFKVSLRASSMVMRSAVLLAPGSTFCTFSVGESAYPVDQVGVMGVQAPGIDPAEGERVGLRDVLGAGRAGSFWRSGVFMGAAGVRLWDSGR